MLFLHEQGYPVVVPVKSRKGHWIETMHDTSIGTVHAVVFCQAAGVRLELDKMSEQQMEQWGRSLAALHNASSCFTPAEPANRMSWEDALALVASVLEEHPEETAAAGELAKVDAWLRSLPANDQDYGLIHYDFELDNVFWEDGSELFSAIDFDDAMYHWYVMDIASTVGDLNVGMKDEHTRSYQLFLNGYQSLRPLNKDLLEQVPGFQRFNDLYGFARVLRAVKDCSVGDDSPPWLGNLLAKLQSSCEYARARFRNYA